MQHFASISFVFIRSNVLPNGQVLPGTTASRMEAWRPILEDCNFNGALSEWTVISGAWLGEWEVQTQAPIFDMPSDLAGTGVWPNPRSPWPSWHGNETVWTPGISGRSWNPSTTVDLRANEQISFGLRFVLAAAGPRSRDGALAAAGEPVIHAVPGYTLATDMNR